MLLIKRLINVAIPRDDLGTEHTNFPLDLYMFLLINNIFLDAYPILTRQSAENV